MAIRSRIAVTTLLSQSQSARLPRARTYLDDLAAITLRRQRLSTALDASFNVSSVIPPGIGLKTSSAVGVAAVAALSESVACPIDAGAIVEICSDASSSAGVTQAGSVDDNWAAAVGGIVIADCRSRDLICRLAPPHEVEILVLIPRQTSRPPCHLLDRRELVRPYRREVDHLIDRLLAHGNVFPIMTRAAIIHASAFGYNLALLDVALKAGALAVSLSGKGPAIAAVCEPNKTGFVTAQWKPYGRVIQTVPSNSGVDSTIGRRGVVQVQYG